MKLSDMLMPEGEAKKQGEENVATQLNTEAFRAVPHEDLAGLAATMYGLTTRLYDVLGFPYDYTIAQYLESVRRVVHVHNCPVCKTKDPYNLGDEGEEADGHWEFPNGGKSVQ